MSGPFILVEVRWGLLLFFLLWQGESKVISYPNQLKFRWVCKSEWSLTIFKYKYSNINMWMFKIQVFNLYYEDIFLGKFAVLPLWHFAYYAFFLRVFLTTPPSGRGRGEEWGPKKNDVIYQQSSQDYVRLKVGDPRKLLFKKYLCQKFKSLTQQKCFSKYYF